MEEDLADVTPHTLRRSVAYRMLNVEQGHRTMEKRRRRIASARYIDAPRSTVSRRFLARPDGYIEPASSGPDAIVCHDVMGHADLNDGETTVAARTDDVEPRPSLSFDLNGVDIVEG